jgi:CubicO group peptidase (beta-lactamase class C family)
MVTAIEDLAPVWEPGTKTGYHAYTFGWIVGELVRRTDPQNRPFGRFVQEEISDPLGMDSFWMGIPDAAEPRCARLINTPPPAADAAVPPPDALILRAIPAQVGVIQEVWGRADVRRACIPGAGGITDARSLARHYAMLAGLGELDGVRLLSEQRVRQISALQTDAVDEVIGQPVRKGMGYFLGGGDPESVGPMGTNPAAFGHPGAGGSIGWADPDYGLAVAIVKNRMLAPPTPEENPVVTIAQAVRSALGVEG